VPSFDIVSEVEKHELQNAIDNTVRELRSRFDFKNSIATISEIDNNHLQVIAEDQFRCNQLLDILKVKMTQRGLDVDCLKTLPPQTNVSEFRLPISIIEGIERDLAKNIVRLVKETKIKVKCQIQENQIRVSGKKRNDLQLIIQQIKDYQFDYPLQFKNFRD